MSPSVHIFGRSVHTVPLWTLEVRFYTQKLVLKFSDRYVVSMFNGKRVVAITWAGRKPSMNILARYIEESRDMIDEWRLCFNTNVKADMAFIDELAATRSYVTLVRHPVPLQEEHRDHVRGWKNWHVMGEFWPLLKFEPDVLYVRFDDDVVYAPRASILSLLTKLDVADDKTLLVSCNVVNNTMCSYINQQRGVIDHSCGTVLNIRNWNDVYGTWSYAEHEHRSFLTSLNTDGAMAWAFPDTYLRGREAEALSIHAIGWRGHHMIKVVEQFKDEMLVEEEFTLVTTVLETLGMQALIVGDAFASHYAYGRQFWDLNKTDVLQQYDRVSLRP